VFRQRAPLCAALNSVWRAWLLAHEVQAPGTREQASTQCWNPAGACVEFLRRTLKTLTARPDVWKGAYERLHGMPPPSEWPVGVVKRRCRSIELKATK
jgi:hypothetical protein